jgi:hypothetical protein
MYKVEVTPVIGLPQFTGWSHVTSISSRLGQFVCAFAVDGEHAGNVGRDLTQLIEENTVESAAGLHELISQLQKTAGEMSTQLSIACGLFTQGRLVMGALHGSIFLKRNDRMGVLLSAKDEINIIEGKNRPEDIVVLATTQAHHFLPEIEQRFSTGFEIDSVIASIIPGLHSLDNSSLSSLAFVFGGREVEMHEPEPEPEPEEQEVAGPVSIEIEPEPVIVTDEMRTPPEVPLEIPIPPALRLRGAGKHREEEIDPTLAELGSESRIVAPPKRITITLPTQKIKGIFVSLWVWLKGLMSKLAQNIGQIRSGAVYVQRSSPRQFLRKALPIGLIMLVIGGILMWWLLTTRSQVSAAKAALAPQLEQLVQARQELNANPLRAREITQAVIGNMQQLETEFDKKRSGKKVITEELTKARSFYDEISGLEAVKELEIFYDLRLVDSEFVSSQVDSQAQRAVFVDGERKRAIVLALDNKQARAISLDEMNAVRDLSVDEDNATFLGNGVFESDVTAAEAVKSIIEEGDSNRGGTLIETFASYVYVLNPEKRNIYRYSEKDDKYSDPIGWVSGAVKFDFNAVTSWAVDGQIWVATNDGVIHQLTSGSEEPFEIKGLTTAFSHPLIIYTRDDLDKLFVLEANSQRVVVLQKDGTFVKEVSSASLASATGLFVNQDGTQAYAVSGSIVYSIPL